MFCVINFHCHEQLHFLVLFCCESLKTSPLEGKAQSQQNKRDTKVKFEIINISTSSLISGKWNMLDESFKISQKLLSQAKRDFRRGWWWELWYQEWKMKVPWNNYQKRKMMRTTEGFSWRRWSSINLDFHSVCPGWRIDDIKKWLANTFASNRHFFCKVSLKMTKMKYCAKVKMMLLFLEQLVDLY